MVSRKKLLKFVRPFDTSKDVRMRVWVELQVVNSTLSFYIWLIRRVYDAVEETQVDKRALTSINFR